MFDELEKISSRIPFSLSNIAKVTKPVKPIKAPFLPRQPKPTAPKNTAPKSAKQEVAEVATPGKTEKLDFSTTQTITKSDILGAKTLAAAEADVAAKFKAYNQAVNSGDEVAKNKAYKEWVDATKARDRVEKGTKAQRKAEQAQAKAEQTQTIVQKPSETAAPAATGAEETFNIGNVIDDTAPLASNRAPKPKQKTPQQKTPLEDTKKLGTPPTAPNTPKPATQTTPPPTKPATQAEGTGAAKGKNEAPKSSKEENPFAQANTKDPRTPREIEADRKASELFDELEPSTAVLRDGRQRSGFTDEVFAPFEESASVAGRGNTSQLTGRAPAQGKPPTGQPGSQPSPQPTGASTTAKGGDELPGIAYGNAEKRSRIVSELPVEQLPAGFERQQVFRSVESGYITGSMAEEVLKNPALADELRNAGVAINKNYSDDFVNEIAKFKKTKNLDDLPAGDFDEGAFRLLGDDLQPQLRPGTTAALDTTPIPPSPVDFIRIPQKSGQFIVHPETKQVLGARLDNGKIRIFDAKERSVERFKQGVGQRNPEVRELAPGAVITDDAIQQVLVRNRRTEPIQLTTVNYGGNQYVVHPNSNAIIGKKTPNGIEGVDPRDVAPLRTRLQDAKRREMPVPQGNNGLYSKEQIAQFKASGDEAALQTIPISEGGRGVQTLDDFKVLEREAQEADRLWRQATELRKGGPEYKAQLETLNQERLKLREQYTRAREDLSTTLLTRRTEQLGSNAQGVEPELEQALKYLESRKIPFFQSTPLVGSGKGYVTPPTPGGILGDSSPMSKALGVGAVGLGGYALLGGGDEPTETSYSGQYGGY